MEIFSPEFLSALFAIVIIDLALAGDNAIVIALAARSLPKDQQKKAILWGTVGAIVVRVIMTTAVVWLLGVPGLMFLGGAVLVWIAVKLLQPADNPDEPHLAVRTTFWGAMQTIVIADATMGLDNVLAVAGAAHGSFVLVVLGLLISIPIVIWGSTLILKWVDRFPAIVYIGVAVLAWTAVKMMLGEPLFKDYLAANSYVSPLAYVAVIGGVFLVGFLKARQRANSQLARQPN
jgi:YjbE family integral membrane protein